MTRFVRRTALLVALALAVVGGWIACAFEIPSLVGAIDGGADVDLTCKCGPAAPVGWSGPFVLVESKTGAPSCPSGAMTVAIGGADPAAAAATCAPCACGPTDGGGCLIHIGGFGSADCDASTSNGGGTNGNPQCTLTVSGNNSSVSIDTLPATAKCTASGGGLQALPDAGWQRVAVGCVPGSAGCSGGAVCTPTSRPCISQLGAVGGCPNPYTQRLAYFTGFVDSRGCAACSCGVPPCQGLVVLSADQFCAGGNGYQVNSANATCPSPSAVGCMAKCTTSLGPYVQSNDVKSGACPPDGGPKGAVTPSGSVTVCCAP